MKKIALSLILVSILAIGWISLDVSSEREKPSPSDWIKKDQIKVYNPSLTVK